MRDHPVARALRAFDRILDDSLDCWRVPALDRVFYPLSRVADHSLLWVALGLGREAIGLGRPGSGLRLAGVLGGEWALTNGLLKPATRRLRPALDPATGPLPFGLREPVTSAFPSGHATSAFTAAAFLARDPLGPAFHVLAALVATSRVYVRLHHPSDVLAGVALGIAFGALARRLVPA